MNGRMNGNDIEFNRIMPWLLTLTVGCLIFRYLIFFLFFFYSELIRSLLAVELETAPSLFYSVRYTFSSSFSTVLLYKLKLLLLCTARLVSYEYPYEHFEKCHSFSFYYLLENYFIFDTFILILSIHAQTFLPKISSTSIEEHCQRSTYGILTKLMVCNA